MIELIKFLTDLIKKLFPKFNTEAEEVIKDFEQGEPDTQGPSEGE